MDLFVGVTLIVASVVLFVYTLYKREEQIEAVKRRISAVQEEYTNK